MEPHPTTATAGFEAALQKLTPALTSRGQFMADLPKNAPLILARIEAGIAAAEIAKTVYRTYGYKVSTDRLVRLVRGSRKGRPVDQVVMKTTNLGVTPSQ